MTYYPILTFSVSNPDLWWSDYSEKFTKMISEKGASEIKPFLSHSKGSWCCYQFKLEDKHAFFSWLKLPETRQWFESYGVHVIQGEFPCDFWYASANEAEFSEWLA